MTNTILEIAKACILAPITWFSNLMSSSLFTYYDIFGIWGAGITTMLIFRFIFLPAVRGENYSFWRTPEGEETKNHYKSTKIGFAKDK